MSTAPLSDAKRRAVSTIATLDILGVADCEIKKALGLGFRDPVVWRWRHGKQGMTESKMVQLKTIFKF